jgi:hypothetical protein
MDENKITEIALEVTNRTSGKHPSEWSDADKVRMIAILVHKFQQNPVLAFSTAIEWNESQSTDVQDDLFMIADKLEDQ